MREVEAGDVHAGVKHFDEHVSVPAGGSQSADNLSLALVQVDLLKDVLESDTGGVSATLILFYHSILTVSSKVCSCVGLCTWTCGSLCYSFY